MTLEATAATGPVPRAELDVTLELALDSLQTMIEIGAGSGATGLEIAVESLRLRVDFVATAAASQGVIGQPIDPPRALPVALRQPIVDESPVADLTSLELVRVGAPLVGVFCRAGKPGGEPFCRVGDQVVAGQQLAILEAMKMMNEVVSPCAGTISEIAVEEGQLVEFGQLLFVIASG